MKKYFYKGMGQRIQARRVERFKNTVTQKQIAVMIGVPYRTYQNWENGKAKPRTMELFIKLANILQADPGWLEFGPKPRTPESVKKMIETYFPKKERA